MADNFLVAQSTPSAGVLTDVYTTGSPAVIAALYIANRSGVATKFRFSIAPLAAADDNKQYLYYDILIPGNDTFCKERVGPVGSGTVLRGYALDATLSFNVFLDEVR